MVRTQKKCIIHCFIYRYIIYYVIYYVIDNPNVDRSFVIDSFKKCHPNSLGNDIFTVLLDGWHARSRIIKELSRQHPDYKSAKSDLTEIFSKLPYQTSYPDADTLADAFDNWIKKYSVCHAALGLSLKQKIKYLGNKLCNIIYNR